MMKHPLFLCLLLWNMVVFFLYAMDKYRARHRLWRVPERTLLLCALLGGGIGALAGMLLLRHKTRHHSFRIVLPMAALLTGALLLLTGWPQQILPALARLFQTP